MVEPSRPLLIDGRFRKDKLLGRGGFGVVYLYKDVPNNRYVAIKQINIDGWTEKEKVQLATEIKTLMQFDHPNIIKLYDYFENDEKIMLVLEYAEEGDLRSLFNKRVQDGQPFTEQELLQYLCMISLGLQQIHQMKIAHCDIKPENIFISKGGILKLGDFGLV